MLFTPSSTMNTFIDTSKQLYGTRNITPVPKVSLAKYFLDRFKEGKQDVALINAHTGDSLTYEELLGRCIKLAHYLKKNNVQKGDVISILSENNINYFVPVLAGLLVGASVQPVHSHLTLGELSALYRISQPTWLFCSENALPLAAEVKNEFSCIHKIVSFGGKTEYASSFYELLSLDEWDATNFEPVEVNITEDVAYIFCSSGTSGLPKCVMLTHSNVTTALHMGFGRRMFRNCNQGDPVLVPLPFSHMYGFNYLQGPLSQLGTTVLMKKFNPEMYLRSIELFKIRKLCCPPTLLRFLAESPLVDLYDLTSVTDITYGSAPSDPAIDLIMKKRFKITPRQIYGATETTGGCVFSPLGAAKIGSCGIVCPEHTIKISDTETQELLGCNRRGEVSIKGPLVMKGYMQNSEETKNCIDKDGFYHTGDVGYYDEDGYIFIVGRMKDLIKYKGFQVWYSPWEKVVESGRGFVIGDGRGIIIIRCCDGNWKHLQNVSPAELENMILTHAAVKEVTVIGIPDARAGEVPMAYVVLNEDYKKDVSEKEIVDFVADRISANKRLYGGVKFIKEIPKNNNGKPLKRVLIELYNKSQSG